jgi:zinc transport system substrate-binding protein
MRSVAMAGFGCLVWATAAGAAPSVVTTIQPVHSLTAAVTAGLTTPTLLLEPGVSPHAYSMTPSDAAALENADVVVWVGEALETFLAGTIDKLAAGAARATLIEAPGLHLLAGDADDGHDHGGHDHGGHDHGHAHGDVDPHVWLSPDNAAAMTRAIAATLAEVDPAHAEAYAANAERAVADIAALETALAAELAPVRDVPFVVFHDAYRYFEEAFGLNAVGAVTLSPDQSPGTRHVAELRRRILGMEAVCVFAEPQFEPRLVTTLVEGTEVRTGELDPVGTGIEPGPDAYPRLMRDLADELVRCLSPASQLGSGVRSRAP